MHRSGLMIFSQVMALRLCNSAKYLVVTLDFEIWPNIYLSPLFFAMLGDIDLIFGMRVYNHKLQINFEIHSG
jgi:hypothetical protein